MKREIGKEWRDADLTHLSVSQLNRTPAYWIYAYLYLRDDRKNIIVGENAAVGTAVHDGLQAICCHGFAIEDQTLAAQVTFDFHDANQDQAKREKYRDCIPDMIRNGVDILTEYGFVGAVDEERIETWLDGVNVPLIGFVDMLVPDTMFCEIKTKAPRKTKLLKDGTQGWAKATLPKAPEKAHIAQAAIYHHALQVTPSICYVTDHDAVMYTPFNCDELKADALADAVEDMRQKALIRQNLLRVSTDPKVLASFTDPDWSHMYQWKIEDEYLEKAKKLWKL